MSVVWPEDLVTLPNDGFTVFSPTHSNRTSSFGAVDVKENWLSKEFNDEIVKNWLVYSGWV